VLGPGRVAGVQRRQVAGWIWLSGSSDWQLECPLLSRARPAARSCSSTQSWVWSAALVSVCNLLGLSAFPNGVLDGPQGLSALMSGAMDGPQKRLSGSEAEAPETLKPIPLAPVGKRPKPDPSALSRFVKLTDAEEERYVKDSRGSDTGAEVVKKAGIADDSTMLPGGVEGCSHACQ